MNVIKFILIILLTMFGYMKKAHAQLGPIYFSPVCEQIPFSDVNFTATNVCDALREAKQNAEGFPRAGLPLTANGTVSNGNWISYSELLANPRILFPVKIRIKEITWVNANTALGAFDFELYKNGQLAGNKIFTYSAPGADRTVGYGYYVFATNIDFDAGESLYIKYVKPSGTSLSDLALIVWIARIL